MKFNNKEKIIFAIVVATWGIFFIGSGLVMQKQIKPIIHTEYALEVTTRKIPEAQAKTNEIKVKDITIEINNPLSVNVKDYLDDVDKVDEKVIRALKLDTSLVNINQAGDYQYTITYKKKKYIGKITVKEKELPNMTFTLKTITLKAGEALSTNPRSYINETITNEVYNNLTLDLSKVDNATVGTYDYYIIYKGTKYQGTIKIDPNGPTIKTKTTESCPSDAPEKDGKCVCQDLTKEYDTATKTCKEKATTEKETNE
ncbi:MAG: hypothetical protein IJG97_00855 [Bacilli bacterium]|nr:hypothetical protein [Bacilli bacterium]